MPIYEFMCDACDAVFETLVFSTDRRAVTCPECGGAVKKLMSAPHIQGDSQGSAPKDCGPSPFSGFS